MSSASILRRLYSALPLLLVILVSHEASAQNITQFTNCTTCAIDYYWCQTTRTCMNTTSSNCPYLISCPDNCPLPYYDCVSCASAYYWCPSS